MFSHYAKLLDYDKTWSPVQVFFPYCRFASSRMQMDLLSLDCSLITPALCSLTSSSLRKLEQESTSQEPQLFHSWGGTDFTEDKCGHKRGVVSSIFSTFTKAQQGLQWPHFIQHLFIVTLSHKWRKLERLTGTTAKAQHTHNAGSRQRTHISERRVRENRPLNGQPGYCWWIRQDFSPDRGGKWH